MVSNMAATASLVKDILEEKKFGLVGFLTDPKKRCLKHKENTLKKVVFE